MDNLIQCDRCGSDACYVQEINHEIKNYQCYGCGFITNTLLTEGSQFFEEQMELLKVSLEDTYNSVGTVTYGPVGTFNQFNTEMLLQKRIDYYTGKIASYKKETNPNMKSKMLLWLSTHIEKNYF